MKLIKAPVALVVLALAAEIAYIAVKGSREVVAVTICIICSFMGLISPAPDFMDVVSVIRKAPRKAMIQDSPNGLYYYPDK